jgi:hypothetical protein
MVGGNSANNVGPPKVLRLIHFKLKDGWGDITFRLMLVASE